MAINKKVRKQQSDENWIYSYADMMSLLLIFFIIFFAISQKNQSDVESFKEAMSKEFSGREDSKSKKNIGVPNNNKEVRAVKLLLAALNLEDNPNTIAKKIFRDKTDKKTIKKLQKSLHQWVDQKNEDLLKIVIPSVKLFQTGSNKLTQKSKIILKAITEKIKNIPNSYSLHITGHTDPTPIKNGLYKDNWELSTARSLSVSRFFMKNGIKPERIQAIGRASYDPIAPNFSADGKPILENQALNRRVTIEVKKNESN